MKSFTDIDDLKKYIPANVLDQLNSILQDTDLEKNDNSLMKIIESWLLKQAMFNKVIEHGDYMKAESFDKNRFNGCIAITLSGSILSIGPKIDGFRKVVYTSIDLRKDVPKIAEEEKAVLLENIAVGKPAVFSQGKIKKTSSVYSLCVPKKEYSGEEEINKIIEINKLLLDNFMQVNNYTFKSNYFDNDLSAQNDLFKQWIIIGWFLTGGFDKHIFMARAKILWLELFTKLYKELIKLKKERAQIEKIFIEFTNSRFTKFIDEYKWYESEKKNFDIGLMKALEEIPLYKTYWDFLDIYLKEI